MRQIREQPYIMPKNTVEVAKREEGAGIKE